jgi:zinc finger protein 830
MSDVRALLNAKRQEARVNHPLASYSEKTGQLKCSICLTIIKHASAWDGHIGSKVHRTNAARLREERSREVQRGREERKRKAEEEGLSYGSQGTKRHRVNNVHDDGGSPVPGQSDLFPADFFSDHPGAPLPASDDESEEEAVVGEPVTVTQPPTLDLEWEKFQQSVLNPPDQRETYERATVFAEPELASEIPDGFPSQHLDDAATGALGKVDEEQARKQKDRDDRELIMDRLLDEEAAQEEADMKVMMMKGKLEALKKKRLSAKAIRSAK